MVLVDSSVWIKYLAGHEPFKTEMERLLAFDQVVGHELVYGELLIGDRGARSVLLAGYDKMHRISTVPHQDVVALVRNRTLHGRGAGWIDVHLLAAALVSQLPFWTADARLAALASELDLAYRIPRLQ